MKKAVAAVMILFAVWMLQNFGFYQPIIITAIPNFFDQMDMVKAGTADFGNFLISISDAFLAMSVIFLSFGCLWVAFDFIASKESDFRAVLTRNPIMLLSIGSGLLFGSQFAAAFASLISMRLPDGALQVVLAIAALEFTMTLLRYLDMNAKKYVFSLKLSTH